MATANVTITTGANFIPELWGTPVLLSLEKNVVISNLVDRRFDKFARNGDTIHVPGVASFTALTLSNMTGTLTREANTESVTDIVINTLYYHMITVDSAAKVQSAYPMLQYYSEKQGIALALKIDTDIAADMVSGITQNEGVDNVDLTDDDIIGAIEQLNVANVPEMKRHMVISTKTYESFMKIDKYVNMMQLGLAQFRDGTKGRGFVGRLYDADLYSTTNVPAGAAGSVNLYFQEECEAHVRQKELTVERRLPADQLAENIIVWGLAGNKIMRAVAGVELRGK